MGFFRFEMVRGNKAMERMTRGIELRLDETEGLVVGLFPVAEVPMHPQSDEMVAVMESVRAALAVGQDSSSSSSDAEFTQ